MRASLVNQLRVLVPIKRTIDYGKHSCAWCRQRQEERAGMDAWDGWVELTLLILWKKSWSTCRGTAVKIRVASDGKGVDQNVKFSMNPFDEIAVEEAVRLREKHKDAITKIVRTHHSPQDTTWTYAKPLLTPVLTSFRMLLLLTDCCLGRPPQDRRCPPHSPRHGR